MNGKRLSIQETIDRLRAGDVATLAKAITLVESKKEEDKRFVNELISNILPYTGNSFRIGFTGIPGAGKSSFIEFYGKKLCVSGKKVAVLAIDPSSPITGGSILGDSTRMIELMQHPLAFVRPSASNGNSGGVHAHTYESILLCEAAGFDYVLIETVGIGQSEGSVREHVDCMVLLTLARGGDDLQGIKRGVLELVDFVIVNKCDGDLIELSEFTKASLKQTMRLVSSPTLNWRQVVMTTSTKTGIGFAEFYSKVDSFNELISRNRFKNEMRLEQKRKWFTRTIKNHILHSFLSNTKVNQLIKQCEIEFLKEGINLEEAVNLIIHSFCEQSSSSKA